MPASDTQAAERPDEDTPEWTEDDSLWAVQARDFDGDVLQVADFIKSRESFLKMAEDAGIPRETFLPFEPNKPGFEDRAKALMNLPAAVGWAAE